MDKIEVFIDRWQRSGAAERANYQMFLSEICKKFRHLLSTTPTANAEQLSQHYGRKTEKRTFQIQGIIETLKGLAQV